MKGPSQECWGSTKMGGRNRRCQWHIVAPLAPG
jgi:hypothetical protein